MAAKVRRENILFVSLTLLTICHRVSSQGCQFYPIGENRRFERVAENMPVDAEVFKLQVYPRNEFKLASVDDNFDDKDYFKFEVVDDQSVSIRVAKPLEDLVDRKEPVSVLKFKLTCRGNPGTEAAFLPVTIYIQDVNDHAPEFLNAPYYLEVDELTPVGLTIFRGLRAVDRDKPNTPNSDISYAIIGGNTDRTFALSDPIDGILIVNKQLDYDRGHRQFALQIQAADRGTPESLTSITTMIIKIKDSDDQNPKFTRDVYYVDVAEKAGTSGQGFAQKLDVQPKIRAIDQDVGINASVKYTIVGGNEDQFIAMDANDGSLYITKEIDREKLNTPTFSLRIQATQVDNSRRYGTARVDIKILDVNDNPPIFEFELYNISVMENLPLGFSVLQVLALDEDQGINGEFTYRLDADSGPFQIDEKAGWIRVKDTNKLDRERQDLISMKVYAVEKQPNVSPEAKPSFTTVEVHLLDANDNNPKFIPSNIYSFSVDEVANPGTIIGYVRAVDADLGANGRVTYYLQNDSLSHSSPFGVDSINGTLFILDRFQGIQNKPPQYTLFVVASDEATNMFERRTSVAVVTVTINDINNSAPEFIDIPYQAYVSESLPPGTTVIQLKARDRDSNSVLTYTLGQGNEDGTFVVEPKTGIVRTAVTLDYEKKSSYDLLVTASDGGNVASTPLSVNVIDVNDQHPTFKHEKYNFSIIEEMSSNLTVGHVAAVDGDSGKNARVRYRLLGNEANSAFQIDDFGNIYTRRRLDREKEDNLHFTIVAFDAGSPQLSGTTNVQVTVEDINDNPPKFPLSEYHVKSEEEMQPPFIVFKLKAEDVDLGDNANITYDVIGGNEDDVFGIERESGLIYTKKKMDYEIKAQYILIVRAKDVQPYQGPDARSIKNPTTAVIVQVTDINDELAGFVQNTYSFNIKEDLTRGSTVGFVNASNFRRSSKEQQITYWISRGNEVGKFWLNPKSGAIILLETVDRDPPATERAFTFEVSARDSKSINKQNATSIIRVNVDDVNDNSPNFDSESYTLQIPENLPTGTEIRFTLKATDIDQGNNGKIMKYVANSPDGAFDVHNRTGNILLRSRLDYEKQTKHTFTVIAVDGGQPPKSGSAIVKIQVMNVNEFSPEFTNLPYEFFAEENAGKGTSIGQVIARDGDNNKIKYSISNGDTDFFTIEEDSGKIYAAATLVSKSKYSFIVTATDDGKPKPRSLSVQIDVHIREANNHPPVFSQAVYNGYVLEKENSDRVIVKVAASDQDYQNNTITYSLSSGNEEGLFFIDQHTGVIKLIPIKAEFLDYDAREQYVLVVRAIDSHKNSLFGLAMVNIEVRDTNNHPPMFNKPAYSSSIAENLIAGHCFLQVKAESGDSIDSITYHLVESSVPFTVDPISGDVCTRKSLDREVEDQYKITVKARDGKYEAIAHVTILVNDENDNAPKFKRSEYYVTIPEGTRIGTSIIDVVAEDPDDKNNGEITYWLKNSHGAFEIDHKTGLVRLINRLQDARTNSSIMMEVFAQDHGVPSKLSKTKLIVEISDTKGRPPVFEKFSYSVNVDENVANIPLLTVRAVSTDTRNPSRMTYSILRQSVQHPISMDHRTGQLTLNSPFDYENLKFVELLVEAKTGGKHPQIATTIVQIIVNDVNDNPPEFMKSPRLVRVPMTTSQSEIVYTVTAIDKDSFREGNNRVTYEIVPPHPMFVIDLKNGYIRPNSTLVPSVAPLRIIASDQGVYPLVSENHLVIQVYEDSGDLPTPVFNSVQYFKTVTNDLDIGASVLDIRASTPNGDPVYFNLTGANSNILHQFMIDHTGRVSSAAPLITEKPLMFDFLVRAYNALNPEHSAETSVSIKVEPLKGKCPKFPFSEYHASLEENTEVNTVVISEFSIEDPHEYGRLSYQISEDDSGGLFYISVKNNIASIKLKKPLDRDVMPAILFGIYSLTITASDQRCAGDTRVKIHILDVNDNPPIFTKKDYFVDITENIPPRTEVINLEATDADELDIDKISYFLIDGTYAQDYFVSGNSGSVSVRVSPDREKIDNLVLKVLAIDSANNTGTANVHIKVMDENDWTPAFVNSTFRLNVTEGKASVGASLELLAIDKDAGENKELEFRIVKGNGDEKFGLRTRGDTGILMVKSALDRDEYQVEHSAIHILEVEARDKGNPSRTGSTTVAVYIEDINDTPPEFEKDSYYEFVSENAPVGYVITTLSATDKDSAVNTQMQYGFKEQHTNLPFVVDPVSGAINISRPLDVSQSKEYTLTVVAFDGLHLTTAGLKIFVVEAEDREARFNQLQYEFNVAENVAGRLVGQVKLATLNKRINSQRHYKIINRNVHHLFNITKDGEIYTRVGLDREKKATYTFTVLLEERRPSKRTSACEVHIVVDDINDEVPTFKRTYEGALKELATPGTIVNIIPTITAVDKDEGANSKIIYSLRGLGSELFGIEDSGTVRYISSTPPDRETKNKYDLQVIATDTGNLTSSTYLTINIEDVNDNPPVFQHGHLQIIVPETIQPGSKLAQVVASDIDEPGLNSRIQYFIKSGGERKIRVDKVNGEVYLVGVLIPDKSYKLNITAVDGGGLSAFTILNITVKDVNDNRPIFRKTEYRFRILEGNYTGKKEKLGVLHAHDDDIGRNGVVEYGIVMAVNADFPFIVDVHTGELFAKSLVNREERKEYNFNIMAMDYGEPPLNSTVPVIITVDDINDENPWFLTDPYLAQVSENKDPGQQVTRVAAIDGDSGKNGQIYYKLGKGHDNKFYIDSKDGTVWTLSSLDYEQKKFFNMTVLAYDQGIPQRSTSAKLWIHVTNENDFLPEFSKSVYSIEVAENAEINKVLYTLDAGENFRYTITDSGNDGTFILDSKTGDIRLAKNLDSEQRNVYKLKVMASDDATPTNKDFAEVNIFIGTGQGVRMFPKRLYSVSVMENLSKQKVILDLNSTEEISNHKVEYSIVGNNYRGLFDIERLTGKLKVTKSLDREDTDGYMLKIKAQKPGEQNSRRGKRSSTEHHLGFDETLINITVADQNDNPPTFGLEEDKPIIAAVPLEAAYGYEIVTIKAKDSDRGVNADIRYRIINADKDSSNKFHIDPITGIIRSVVTFSLDGRSVYNFEVKATDSLGSDEGMSAVAKVIVYVLPETQLVVMVARTRPIVVEDNLPDILQYLGNVTGYTVKVAKLEAHIEGEEEYADASDLYLYAVDEETDSIVDIEELLGILRERSDEIRDYLDTFQVYQIRGVTLQVKVSQMGTTEVAIIALSTVIFFGAILGIATVCCSCRKKKLKKKQNTMEQQRLYNIKNTLVSSKSDSQFTNRMAMQNNESYHINQGYNQGIDSLSQDFSDSFSDSASTLKRKEINARRQRQQVPPDGASIVKPPRSPHFGRYSHSNASSQRWYNYRDPADSLISGQSGRSKRSRMPSTEL